MNLSKAAHRFAPVVMLALGVLMALGLLSYFKLPTREDPAILIRDAIVSTEFPGMDAERVERLITKTIEAAIVITAAHLTLLVEVRDICNTGLLNPLAGTVIARCRYSAEPLADSIKLFVVQLLVMKDQNSKRVNRLIDGGDGRFIHVRRKLYAVNLTDE